MQQANVAFEPYSDLDEDEECDGYFRSRANTWPLTCAHGAQELPLVEGTLKRKQSMDDEFDSGYLEDTTKRARLDYSPVFSDDGSEISDTGNELQDTSDALPKDYQLAWVEVEPGKTVLLALPTPLLMRDMSSGANTFCDASCQTDEESTIRPICAGVPSGESIEN